MQRQRRKDTELELAIRRTLYRAGLRHRVGMSPRASIVSEASGTNFGQEAGEPVNGLAIRQALKALQHHHHRHNRRRDRPAADARPDADGTYNLSRR